MYWEEAVELIKTHQGNPGRTYDYHKGTLKSGYIDIESFPLSLKKGIEKSQGSLRKTLKKCRNPEGNH